MEKLKENLKLSIQKGNKEIALKLILNELKDNKIDIFSLYSKILFPAMYTIECKIEDREKCIWKEHMQNSILRTIIENCYLFVKREKRTKYSNIKGKVIVICPPEEYYEIWARLVSDIFEINGYDSIFIGADTSRNEFINSINVIKPDFVVISINNPYNLFSAKNTLKIIKENNSSLKIIVGGNAFINKPDLFKEINADFLISGLNDIETITEGDIK